MGNTYGCAPIYFLGAILFLTCGGILIYYDYAIIGAIMMAPGFILLGLTFFALDTLFRIKRGDDDINVVIRDPELLKEMTSAIMLTGTIRTSVPFIPQFSYETPIVDVSIWTKFSVSMPGLL